MFHQIKQMTKMTMKLLLRNKGFVFFAILLPILATVILNINNIDSQKEEVGQVIVLEKMNTQMAYIVQLQKYPVKVYNQSESKESEVFIQELASGGIFQVFEVKCKKQSKEDILASVQYTSMHDKVNGIIIINDQFENEINEGKIIKSIKLFQVGDDKRNSMLESFTKEKLTAMLQKEKIIEDNVQSPEVKIQELQSTTTKTGITIDIDADETYIFGTTLALYTVAFIFAGIMILGTIMSERENLVFTRIMLTDAKEDTYLLSKFTVIILTSVLETVVACLSYQFLVKTEVGLSLAEFAFILFGMALIFNSISVGVGICCDNTLTACLMAFTVWVITALLGGLYFDISNASDTFKKIALLMPQRWGLKAASLFMNGDATGYPLMCIVTMTYVIIVLMIGVLGLKVSRKE